MLDTFYRQLFRPSEAPPSPDIAGLIAGLLLLVMTFNAASSLQISASGLSFILIVFGVGGFLGVFWFASALFTLSSFFGGSGSIQTLLPALLVGLWPLILSGAALAAQRNIPLFGGIVSLAVVVGTFITLARSIAAAQAISPIRSTVLIFVTMTLSGFAVGGVVIWPFMLLLGL